MANGPDALFDVYAIITRPGRYTVRLEGGSRSDNTVLGAYSGTLSVVSSVAPLPAPAMLMAAALGGLGLARHRRSLH